MDKRTELLSVTDVLMMHEKAINDLQKFERMVYIAAVGVALVAVGALLAKVLGV